MMCAALTALLIFLGAVLLLFVGFSLGFSAAEKKAVAARVDKMISDLQEKR